MTDSRQSRRFINLPKENEGPIGRWLALHDGEPPIGALSKVAERYLTVIGKSIPNFDDSEWCLIFDALRPPWPNDYSPADMLSREVAEAIAADHLDEKWRVDGTRLKGRVSRLSFAEKLAVSEVAEAFWEYPVGPEPLREIIVTIKTSFQPPSTSRTSNPIRRLSTDRLRAHPPVSPDKQGSMDQDGGSSTYKDQEGRPEPPGVVHGEATNRSDSEDDSLDMMSADTTTEFEHDLRHNGDGQDPSRPLL